MVNSRPVKLLVVIGSLNRGGAETHLLGLLPRLDRTRFAAEVFVLAERGELAAEMEAAGIPVSTPWVASQGRSGLLFRAFRLAAVVLQLWLHLLIRRPAIVHFFLPESYQLGGVVALLAGVRCRVMSRRGLNHYQSKRRWAGRLERLLHKSVRAALGNSATVIRELQEEGLPAARLHLIYNGIDVSLFDQQPERNEARRALQLPADALVLVVVANLIPYKGHEDLLNALAGVAGRMPQPWTVLCVGRDDGIGERLRRLATDLGIAEAVRFLGSRSDVPSILRAADIGILSSHEEGFSNAILEGMAAGLPMVVTDVGGNREAVADGITGYVVPPHRPVELGEAIARLVARTDRAELGRRARARVESKFSLDACVAAYESLYSGLLSSDDRRLVDRSCAE